MACRCADSVHAQHRRRDRTVVSRVRDRRAGLVRWSLWRCARSVVGGGVVEMVRARPRATGVAPGPRHGVASTTRYWSTFRRGWASFISMSRDPGGWLDRWFNILVEETQRRSPGRCAGVDSRSRAKGPPRYVRIADNCSLRLAVWKCANQLLAPEQPSVVKAVQKPAPISCDVRRGAEGVSALLDQLAKAAESNHRIHISMPSSRLNSPRSATLTCCKRMIAPWPVSAKSAYTVAPGVRCGSPAMSIHWIAAARGPPWMG